MFAIPKSNENITWTESIKSFVGTAIGAAAFIELVRKVSSIVEEQLHLFKAGRYQDSKMSSEVQRTIADEVIAFAAQTIAITVVKPLVFKMGEKFLGANCKAMDIGQISSELVSPSKSTIIGSSVAGVYALFQRIFVPIPKLSVSLGR